MNVLEARIGHGELGRDGSLGYSAPITSDKVMLRKWPPYHEALSAHADSELLVEFDTPVLVEGALNASAKVHGTSCEFWVNDHWLGDLDLSCQRTHGLSLPPGKYRLGAKSTGGNWGMHSLWLVQESVFQNRLALVTAGCYPRADLKDRVHWLHRSAARQGILLHVMGVDTPYDGHVRVKIERVANFIRELPPCYDHVLYMDGRDTLLLGGEADVLDRLKVFAGAVVGAEACAWPVVTEEYDREFGADGEKLVFPQAGMWGGLREPVLDCLDGLLGLQRKYPDDTPDWLRRYLAAYPGDDQLLWQAAHNMDILGATLDDWSYLFCNLTCTNTVLADRDKVWVQGDGVLTRRGTRPLCLHFSGSGFDRLPQWAGYLGL